MIFIVDDDQAFRQSLSLLLGGEGMESQGFTDARDFLDRCDPSNSDRLIVDVDLPGMDGIELLRRLRVEGLKLPVLVVTGHPSTFLRQQAREAGATAFLEKPVRIDDILPLVRQSEASSQ